MAPRIAIIGGGPAGLTCARMLQLHGLTATIYEHEKSTASRSQGGSLDLHDASGMKAVIAAGLVQQFNAKARPEGDEIRFLDKTGQLLLKIKPDDKGVGAEKRPEIDRAQLREILLESLNNGTIHWGRKLVTVESSHRGEGSGTHTLVFEDGAREEVDLVIGADGAWSKVRPLLSDETPAYTGVTFVDCVIENVDARFPNLAQACGHGLCLILSLDRGLIVQRNANEKIHVYVAVKVDEGWVKGEFADAARDGPEGVRRLLLSFFDGWSPAVLDFIHKCDDESIWARPLYALPVDHTWSSKPGLTLVGDAAHVMVPFAGEGVNIAMLDALELAVALARAWEADPCVGSLYGAIPGFERAMSERAKQAASVSASNQVLFFNERAPHDFLEMMVATRSGAGPAQ